MRLLLLSNLLARWREHVANRQRRKTGLDESSYAAVKTLIARDMKRDLNRRK